MEFSYSYRNIISQFSRADRILYGFSGADSQDLNTCPVEIRFKLSREGGEVPIIAFNAITQQFGYSQSHRLSLEEGQFITVVVPLLGMCYKNCKGADTIMKAFTQFSCRIIEARTPDESYYGGTGFVLDKDYKRLLYLTKSFSPTTENTAPITVHVSPTVFLNDKSALTKAIIKKCIPFYLSQYPISSREPAFAPKIVIDDGSELFFTPNKPTPGININKDINNFLKGEIGEVLGQLK